MNKPMNTLENYFSQAANRPLAFSEENIRHILQEHDAGRSAGRWTVGRRITRLTILGLLLAAATGVLFRQSALPVDTDHARSRANSEGRLAPASTDQPATSSEVGSSAATLAPRTTGSGSTLPPLLAFRVSPPIMIDLRESEVSALGLRRLEGGRTAFAYYLVGESTADQPVEDAAILRSGYSDSLLVRTVSAQGLRDVLLSRADFPLGIVTRRASPIASTWQIVTDDEGRLLDNRVRPFDGQQLRALTALFVRGLSGGDLQSSVDSIAGVDAIGRELRLNTLLPIRVPLGSTSNPRAIFWCRADAELLAQLPTTAVDRLRTELEALASVVGPSDTLSIVRRGWALSVLETLDAVRPQSLALDKGLDLVGPVKLTGGEILGGSQLRAGSIARFRPASNVVTGSLHVAVALDQPRRVNITLHDIQGRRVRALVQDRSLEEGETDVALDVANVPKGLYLIALTSDRDEQVIQRIVIE